MELVHWIGLASIVTLFVTEILTQDTTPEKNVTQSLADQPIHNEPQSLLPASPVPMAPTYVDVLPQQNGTNSTEQQSLSTINTSTTAASVPQTTTPIPLAKLVSKGEDVPSNESVSGHRDYRQGLGGKDLDKNLDKDFGNDFGSNDTDTDTETDNEEPSNTTLTAVGEVVKDGGKNKLFVETRAELKQQDMDYSCEGGRGILSPIYPDSKFFAAATRTFTWEEARDICEGYQLSMAEVNTIEEHRVLQYYISYQFTASAFKASDSKYYIGLNDRDNEGVYMKANGKNISFQTYHPSQPDDDDMAEDCTALGKETYEGPVGMSDVDCKKRFRVLCMFPKDSVCLNDTVEAKANYELLAHKGLVSFSNMSTRLYFVSNFQLIWKDALSYCVKNNMLFFDMDDVVTAKFFDALLDWETKFVNASIPTLQYWTAGKFQGTQMNAEVYWHTEPKHNPIAEFVQNKNFTFTGIFKWSSKKKKDPGGPHGWRRDLCLSFGFDAKPESTPFARNTNCDLPAYFICSMDKPSSDEKEGD